MDVKRRRTVSLTRYYKHKEPPEVAQHMHFYDTYGNLLHNVIELDTAQDNGEPNGKRINAKGEVELCYYKYASAVVDGIVDPTEEHLHAFRQLHSDKLRHFSKLPQEERHALTKSLASMMTNITKAIVATCPNCQHKFDVEQERT